jgi:hypothetical protein
MASPWSGAVFVEAFGLETVFVEALLVEMGLALRPFVEQILHDIPLILAAHDGNSSLARRRPFSGGR